MSIKHTTKKIEHNNPDLSIYNIISHELKAPINSITKITDILEHKIDHLPDETILKMLANIREGAKNLNAIAEYLADMPPINDDQLKMNFSWHNLVDVLHDVTTTCNSFIGLKHDVTLYFGYEAGEYDCLIDIFWFKQLVINLVVNSIKFTKKGSIFLHLETYMQDEYPYFKITCMDEGIGVDKSNLENIFTPFVVIPSEDGSISNGQGLGLAIAKKITDLHGAHIIAKKNSDLGTRVEILIRKESKPESVIDMYKEA